MSFDALASLFIWQYFGMLQNLISAPITGLVVCANWKPNDHAFAAGRAIYAYIQQGGSTWLSD
jgi:hypothetical protein